METPSSFPTILTSAIVIVALAVVAAVLPSSEEKKDIRDFRIQYGIETRTSRADFDGEISDFLNFRLNPTEVAPLGKITRSKAPSSKKIVKVEKPELSLIRSPAEFIVKISDNTEAIFEELRATVFKVISTRKAATLSSNPEDCAAIENARTSENCRGEIYFQIAVKKYDYKLCEKIKNEELQLRCHKYFQ